MTAIRIGIIGYGQWGPNHVRNFSACPNAQVAAIADSRSERLRAARATAGHVPHHFATYQELLHSGTVDAVVVATPTATHGVIVREALEAGLHVLCEKPLCATAAEGEALVELARRQRRLLMVGHVFLFNSGILKLREYLQAGTLGDLYYLSARRTNLGPIREDVNVAYDLAAHDLAIFQFLLGRRPTELSAVGRSFLQPNIQDVAFITLTYPPQTLAHIQVSWLDPKKVREITLVGSRKMAVWNDLASAGPVMLYDVGVLREQYYDDFGHFQLLPREGDITIPRVQMEEPLRAQSRYFLRCIERGAIEYSDGSGGVEVVRLLEAVNRSMAQGGQPVRLEG